MLFGTVLLLPIAVAEGMVPAVAGLDWELLGLVVFLGVLGGAAAFLLWTWALSRITPTQVAVYVNLNPIVAALLGIAPAWRAAQPHVRARLRGRGHRGPAGQLAGDPPELRPRVRQRHNPESPGSGLRRRDALGPVALGPRCPGPRCPRTVAPGPRCPRPRCSWTPLP
jgi:hypothetical protein